MIRELPLLPEFTYRYTCRRCGCHNVSFIPFSGGFDPECLMVCSWCGWSYPILPDWRVRRPLTVEEWEIRQALGWLNPA